MIMFRIGLELDLNRLARVRAAALWGTGAQAREGAGRLWYMEHCS